MQEPLVSIIMGVFNEEQTLERCMESILNQTYTNWEFVICDDCSTDSSYNILQKYAKLDSRIKVLQNKTNCRLAASLNRCLKVANGVYIARMDADDISLPERLAKQVRFLETSEFDVVGCAAKISDGTKIVGIRVNKEYPNKNDVLKGPTFMHPTIMMKKTVYDVLDGYTVADRTRRGQDWDLWFKFFSKGFTGYNMQEPLLIYHESEADLKKRTFKAAVGTMKTAILGFRLMKVPIVKYYLVLKPIISWFVPEKIKKLHRKEVLR